MKNAVEVHGLKVYTGYFASTTPDALRQMAASIEDGIAVLCGEQGGKVTIAASCSKSAIDAGVKAGVLVKEVAAVTGGKGGGKGGGAMVGTPPGVGRTAWDLKKIWGVADVYEDGSAFFRVPARTPLYFQALDERGYVVQTMRSWSTLQPGETQSCVGCH